MYRIHLRRSAFTLIELLVVIAIIAILASLLMGGVMMFLRKGPEVVNRNDVLQLSTNLGRFYHEHKMYPPDRIRLCSHRSSYGSTALDQQSLSYIAAIWPNIKMPSLPMNASSPRPINWGNRTGWTTASTSDDTLEGDQCLVFFLGGLPNGANQAPQGFYHNPGNPTEPADLLNPQLTDRVKYHDFDSARCVLLRANPFPSYLDAHCKDHQKPRPFVYFTSGRRPNGYNSVANSITISPACPAGVFPYIQQAGTLNKYYNPTTFQIISAGTDGEFGPGGAWTPGGGNNFTKDDISNFHGGQLGSQ